MSDYFSGNRFLSMAEMKVNAQYIYNYLYPRGWTVNAISAILGNMQTESTINPAIWEGLVVDENRGFGLVQWTPATKYLNWCYENGLNPELMESNLERILWEVENNVQWGNDSKGNPPPFSFYEFTRSTLPPGDLAIMFLLHYERPANQNQPKRAEQAEFWYTFITGLPAPPPTPPPPTSYPKSKKGKVYLYKRKRRFKLYVT